MNPLFKDCERNKVPAKPDQIERFKQEATAKEVPQQAIDELVKFYEVANGIPCLDSVSIHEINDPILYEFWDEKELWIGQRDMDMIRWFDGKFHIGDAGYLNYGAEYVFTNLIELFVKGFNDWHPNG